MAIAWHLIEDITQTITAAVLTQWLANVYTHLYAAQGLLYGPHFNSKWKGRHAKVWDIMKFNWMLQGSMGLKIRQEDIRVHLVPWRFMCSNTYQRTCNLSCHMFRVALFHLSSNKNSLPFVEIYHRPSTVQSTLYTIISSTQVSWIKHFNLIDCKKRTLRHRVTIKPAWVAQTTDEWQHWDVVPNLFNSEAAFLTL